MPKKILLTVAAFLLLGACVLGVGSLVEPATDLHAIEADSPCPVARCASGECHGFDDVPEPDGIHEMTCPEAGCASVECHAWDSLTDRYHQASDASLNVWVLAPVALVVGLVALVRLLSRGDARGGGRNDSTLRGAADAGGAQGGKQGGTSTQDGANADGSRCGGARSADHTAKNGDGSCTGIGKDGSR